MSETNSDASSSSSLAAIQDDETSEYRKEIQFLKYWCNFYGLSTDTFRYLDGEDILESRDILFLTPSVIGEMNLPPSQRCILRGAVLQYFANKKEVNRLIRRQIRKNRPKTPPPKPAPAECPQFDLEEKIKSLAERLNNIPGLREFQMKWSSDLHRRATKKRSKSLTSTDQPTMAQRILQNRGKLPSESDTSEENVEPQTEEQVTNPFSSPDGNGLSENNFSKEEIELMEQIGKEEVKTSGENTGVEETKVSSSIDVHSNDKSDEEALNNKQLDRMIDGDFEEELDKVLKEQDSGGKA